MRDGIRNSLRQPQSPKRKCKTGVLWGGFTSLVEKLRKLKKPTCNTELMSSHTAEQIFMKQRVILECQRASITGTYMLGLSLFLFDGKEPSMSMAGHMTFKKIYTLLYHVFLSNVFIICTYIYLFAYE